MDVCLSCVAAQLSADPGGIHSFTVKRLKGHGGVNVIAHLGNQACLPSQLRYAHGLVGPLATQIHGHIMTHHAAANLRQLADVQGDICVDAAQDDDPFLPGRKGPRQRSQAG